MLMSTPGMFDPDRDQDEAQRLRWNWQMKLITVPLQLRLRCDSSIPPCCRPSGRRGDRSDADAGQAFD